VLVGAEVGVPGPRADVEPLAQHHPVPQLRHAAPIRAATQHHLSPPLHHKILRPAQTRDKIEQQKRSEFDPRNSRLKNLSEEASNIEQLTCICIPPPLRSAWEAPGEAAMAASWLPR